MATSKHRRRTAIENAMAGAVGTGLGYAAGVGATTVALKHGPLAARLAKLSPNQRRKEIAYLKGIAGAGSATAGTLAGLVARQRLRKARKQDKLTSKLAEIL